MKDYREKLRAIIHSAEDLPRTHDIIANLAKDRAALQELIGEYFNAINPEVPRDPKQVGQNFLSLIPPEMESTHAYHFGFGLSVHEPGSSPTIASQTAYTNLSPVNVPLYVKSFWLPEDWDIEVFDDSLELREGDEFRLDPGRVLSMKPDRQTFHFRFEEPTILLKVQSHTVTAFEWSFDATTRKAWQSISTRLTDSNAVHTCVRAQALRDRGLIAPLQLLLDHERHFVRWSAAKALGFLSFEAGWSALEKLQQDQHPHVVRAAKRAMAQASSLQRGT